MLGAGIRSLLFVPGDNETLILKAFASEADAVIIDLEDAVAPEKKSMARGVCRELLSGADRKGKQVFVRLNAFDTGLTALDAAAVLSAQPWGVVLPKSLGAADVMRLSYILDGLEARDGFPAGSTRIMTVATETAAAVLGLSHPGQPLERLWGMLWGGEDLSAALGAHANRDADGTYTHPYDLARTQCLYAANALGAVAVDAVYTSFRDAAGLEAETLKGLRDGFTAKAAIHPAQVEIINRVLTPAPAQLDWARDVVQLLDTAAVARLDGQMVDLAHKRIAERLLRRAAAIAGGDHDPHP